MLRKYNFLVTSMKDQITFDTPPNKICILRLSALGDVTHVIPVVRAIQKNWPDTEITWVCGKFEKKLILEIQGIRFIEFDKKQGWHAYRDLYRALKGEVFDVLLHMQVAARANLASMFIRSPVKIGWDKKRSRDFHQLFINYRVPVAQLQHQVQGFLSFARAMGLDVEEPTWDFPVSDTGLDFANQYVSKDKKVLLISPCSSHMLRNWKADAYAKIADYAIEQLDMQVILSGGPSQEEKDMADEIESGMSCSLTNLVGKDTLQQLVGLLSRVDVVISPDSGPAHIANAVGTPVIGLYACTWSKRSGPYNYLDYCVDKFEVAARRYLEKTARELRWGTKIELPGVMSLIEINEVKEKLTKIAQTVQ